MQARNALVMAVCCMLAACGADPTRPGLDPDELAGTYALVESRGESLPVASDSFPRVIGQEQVTCWSVLVSGSLELHRQQNYWITHRRLTECDNGHSEAQPDQVETGTFRIEGTVLRFTYYRGEFLPGYRTATVEGPTITFIQTGQTTPLWVFERTGSAVPR